MVFIFNSLQTQASEVLELRDLCRALLAQQVDSFWSPTLSSRVIKYIASCTSSAELLPLLLALARLSKLVCNGLANGKTLSEWREILLLETSALRYSQN